MPPLFLFFFLWGGRPLFLSRPPTTPTSHRPRAAAPARTSAPGAAGWSGSPGSASSARAAAPARKLAPLGASPWQRMRKKLWTCSKNCALLDNCLFIQQECVASQKRLRPPQMVSLSICPERVTKEEKGLSPTSCKNSFLGLGAGFNSMQPTPLLGQWLGRGSRRGCARGDLQIRLLAETSKPHETRCAWLTSRDGPKQV